MTWRSARASAARARCRPVDHPHIVTVYEAGETERRPVHRDAAGPRPDAEGPDRVRRARAGADACASSGRWPTRSTGRTRPGMIHRDIKPQNILVGERDHAYLADFGLTKDAGETEPDQDRPLPRHARLRVARADPWRAGRTASDIYALAGRAVRVPEREVPFPRRPRRRCCTPTCATRAAGDELPARLLAGGRRGDRAGHGEGAGRAPDERDRDDRAGGAGDQHAGARDRVA